MDLDENNFAIREINLYYSENLKSRYDDCIKSTLTKLEDDSCELNQLLTNDLCKNIIIKKLYDVFVEKLEHEKQNNPIGIFGVTKAHFPDGIRWYYKDLIKKEFYPTYPFFADNLDDLKIKVRKNNSFWYIFDGDKVKKQRDKFNEKKKFSDSILLQKEINLKSKTHMELTKRERETDRKAKEVDEILDSNYHDKFKKDKYKFFK